jgi:hypothetical protein
MAVRHPTKVFSEEGDCLLPVANGPMQLSESPQRPGRHPRQRPRTNSYTPVLGLCGISSDACENFLKIIGLRNSFLKRKRLHPKLNLCSFITPGRRVAVIAGQNNDKGNWKPYSKLLYVGINSVQSE